MPRLFRNLLFAQCLLAMRCALCVVRVARLRCFLRLVPDISLLFRNFSSWHRRHFFLRCRTRRAIAGRLLVFCSWLIIVFLLVLVKFFPYFCSGFDFSVTLRKASQALRDALLPFLRGRPVALFRFTRLFLTFFFLFLSFRRHVSFPARFCRFFSTFLRYLVFLSGSFRFFVASAVDRRCGYLRFDDMLTSGSCG